MPRILAKQVRVQDRCISIQIRWDRRWCFELVAQRYEPCCGGGGAKLCCLFIWGINLLGRNLSTLRNRTSENIALYHSICISEKMRMISEMIWSILKRSQRCGVVKSMQSLDILQVRSSSELRISVSSVSSFGSVGYGSPQGECRSVRPAIEKIMKMRTERLSKRLSERFNVSSRLPYLLDILCLCYFSLSLPWLRSVWLNSGCFMNPFCLAQRILQTAGWRRWHFLFGCSSQSVDFRVQHIVRRVALSMHCRPARTARRFLWHLLIGLTVAIYVFQKAFKKIMVTLPGPTQAEAVSVTWLWTVPRLRWKVLVYSCLFCSPCHWFEGFSHLQQCCFSHIQSARLTCCHSTQISMMC